MSTILKTLRKLEEEKSLLNQKLDLEQMLLKEDSSYPKLVGSGRWKFFLLIGIVSIFLIAVGVTFYRPAPNYEASTSIKNPPKKKSIQQTIKPKDSSTLQTFEGIPMAAIPSKESASNPKKKLLSKPFTKLLFDEALPVKTSPDIVKVESIIRPSANITKKTPSADLPIQTGYIPGMKIKGIIFFYNGSSSNHIIVTTENNTNLKLREGEAFQNTVVESIHPNYVIFSHHNQLIEVAIGR
jgi:hypothetical protein